LDGNPAVVAVSPPAAIKPGLNEKECFQCAASGSIACRAGGCKAGRVDCPGPCLKLSKGAWKRMNVAGHDPSELWISFKKPGGSTSWSQNHVGEVIQYQNGQPVNVGACKVCSGAASVNCTACNGGATQSCDICAGKKFVPIAWTPTDNPSFNSQPDLIRLTDGRAILGRIAASSGDERTIVTRDKKVVRVQASEILPKAEANLP
jgi:hypothetical protein